MAAEAKVQAKVVRDMMVNLWTPFRCKTEGWPDRGFMKNGRIVFFEFKAPVKKPRPLQLFIHEIIRKQGFQVFVVDNWDDYKKIKSEVLDVK